MRAPRAVVMMMLMSVLFQLLYHDCILFGWISKVRTKFYEKFEWSIRKEIFTHACVVRKFLISEIRSRKNYFPCWFRFTEQLAMPSEYRDMKSVEQCLRSPWGCGS